MVHENKNVNRRSPRRMYVGLRDTQTNADNNYGDGVLMYKDRNCTDRRKLLLDNPAHANYTRD
jgi:hypothetical protein